MDMNSLDGIFDVEYVVKFMIIMWINAYYNW
jgi:hypothetical protein